MKRLALFFGAAILTTAMIAQDSTDWFVYGCTDPLALNYNPQATIDDGSCVYDNGDSTDWFVYGCTDPLALNYNPQATIDDGSCVYDNSDSTDWFVYGCTDPLALNYNPQATIDDGSCVYDNGDSTDWFVYGCTDPLALNYNPQATIDDGSCVYNNGDSNEVFCNAYFTAFIDSNDCNVIWVENMSEGQDLSFIWTFGDGGSSFEEDVEYTYFGTEVLICLDAFSADSCWSVHCDTLFIEDCAQAAQGIQIFSSNGGQPLSIHEASDTELQVWPNPSEGSVSISGIPFASGGSIVVRSIDGREVHRQMAYTDRMQLELGTLPDGCYLIIWEGSTVSNGSVTPVKWLKR